MYEIQGYLDKDDFWTGIGTIVGYEENFLNSGNQDKLYVIRSLPNYGNTVIMREAVINGNTGFSCIVGNSDIEVEPWKIGAI